MVSKNLQDLSLEQLTGVVSAYPWFGGAREELCRRMAIVGGWTREQFAREALYVADRGAIGRLALSAEEVNYADTVDTDIADNFGTEELAKIFAQQGFPQEAKRIYSRLVLEFPEKSAYFAALIEKLEKS